MNQRPGNEIVALTSLRMIAALLVYLHHFILPDRLGITNKFIAVVFTQGHIGVGIFFTLSGFLITYRYLSDIVGNGGQKFSLYDYLRKRIARIWILYYTVLCLTFYLLEEKSIRDITWINLTLTQGFFRERMFDGVPTAWSLTVEESFYLLAPMIFFTFALVYNRFSTIGWRTHMIFICNVVVWGIVLILAGKLLFNYVHQHQINKEYYGFMENSTFIRYYTIFERFFDFGCGMIAAYIYLNIPAIKIRYFTLIVMLYSVIAISLLLFAQVRMYELNYDSPAGLRYNYLVSFATAILIMTLTHRHNILARFLSWPVFAYLGRISYSLYLIQMTPVVRPIETVIMYQGDYLIWYILVLYVGLNFVAAGLYEFVEKPGRSIFLNLTERTRWRKPLLQPVNASID